MPLALWTRTAAAIGVMALLMGVSSGLSPAASAAEPLAPVAGHEPSLSYHTWNDLTAPATNPDGSTKTGPQLGDVVLVDPGTWSNMVGTTFSYQWKTSSNGTSAINAATVNGMPSATHRDYPPSLSQIGEYLAVTVTATNSSGARGVYTVYTQQRVVGINPNRVKPYPTSGAVGPGLVANGGSIAPGENKAWLTWYGVPDNTPPGAAIGGPSTGATNTYPGNYGSAVHSGNRAGGDGSYSNPLTAATADNLEAPYGVEFYVPAFRKYFVTEDACTECLGDWSGSGDASPDTTLIGPGGDGGPGLIHFDLWIDGGGGSWVSAIQCENALTPDPTDPALIIMDPNPGMPVNANPVENPKTGQCNYFEDNGSSDFASWPERSANLTSTNSVGPYRNLESGNCITDPGNSAVVGTLVTMKPCDHSASQNFSSVGLLIMINNLCLDMGNQNGDLKTARVVSLQKCNFDVGQLWEGDGNGLSDVQNSVWALADGSSRNSFNAGNKYFEMARPANVRLSGPTNQRVVNSSTDGLLVATYTANDIQEQGYGNQWQYPEGPQQSSQIALRVTADNRCKNLVEITGSGVNTPRVELDLRTVGSAPKTIATLAVLNNVGATGTKHPDNNGTFSRIVKIPSGIAPGSYQITATGLSSPPPAGTVLVSGDVFTKADPLPQSGGSGPTTLASFPAINQTVPMVGSAMVKISAGGHATA